jgi:hypothetical protein
MNIQVIINCASAEEAAAALNKLAGTGEVVTGPGNIFQKKNAEKAAKEAAKEIVDATKQSISTEQTKTPKIGIAEIRAKAKELQDAKGPKIVVDALQKHGFKNVSSITPDKFDTVYEELSTL